MTEVRQVSDANGDGPLEALHRLVAQARRVENIELTEVSGDDPLVGLRLLMAQAKEQEEGQGGKALRELQAQIESARKLPEAQAYRRPAANPLEILEARIRGDLPTEEPVLGEQQELDAVSEEKAPTGGRDEHSELGAALEASLRQRPLAGEVRAEVALRLASLLEGPAGPEIKEVWELVVFGGSSK